MRNNERVRENLVLEDLQKRLKSIGAEIRKTTGDPRNSGDPDIIGCLGGQFIAVETKRPGKERPTQQQEARLARWRKAGAIAIWANDAAQAYLQIMTEITRRQALVEQEQHTDN